MIIEISLNLQQLLQLEVRTRKKHSFLNKISTIEVMIKIIKSIKKLTGNNRPFIINNKTFI